MNSKYIIVLLLTLILSSCVKDNKEITLYVSGKTTSCETSETPCLKIKTDLNDDWTTYSGTINGFTHQLDKDFTLKVKSTTPNNDTILSGDFELIEVIASHKSPIELGEGSWNVTFLLENETFERAPFLTITDAETRIQGSTSCNKFRAPLISKNGSFSIGEIVTTKMACPDLNIETTFLQALQKASTYEVIDDVLHLLAEDGTILIKAMHLNVRQ